MHELRGLALDATASIDGDRGYDIAVDVDGGRVYLEIASYALVDVPRALHIVRSLSADQIDPARPAMLVIGQRIVEGARAELRRAGVSWFDRRGHLYLRAPGLRIDTRTGSESSQLRSAGGRVRLAVAIDLLLHSPAHLVVRETARRIGAAPSSVSEAAKSLREDGVLEAGGASDPPGLFWLAADLWKPAWTAVERYPHPDSAMRNPALRLGFDDPSSGGWALSGDLAAAHLGAPIGLKSGAAPDLYVPGAQVHRLAVSILGRGSEERPSARIAVQPVSPVCEERIDVASETDEVWLVARPLFVALDIAQDPGRGVEILRDWHPAPWGLRVW